MGRKIRLTEGQLKQVIWESKTRNLLREMDDANKIDDVKKAADAAYDEIKKSGITMKDWENITGDDYVFRKYSTGDESPDKPKPQEIVFSPGLVSKMKSLGLSLMKSPGRIQRRDSRSSIFMGNGIYVKVMADDVLVVISGGPVNEKHRRQLQSQHGVDILVNLDPSTIKAKEVRSVPRRTNFDDEKEMLPMIQAVIGDFEISRPGQRNWDERNDQIVYLGSVTDGRGDKVLYFKTSQTGHYYMLPVS